MTADRRHCWPPLPTAVRKKAGLGLTPKGRQKTGLFLIEGFRLLKSAFDHRWPIESLIVREDGVSAARLEMLLKDCRIRDLPVYTAAPTVFDLLTAMVEPAGVVALARQQPTSTEDLLTGKRLLVADNVRDPGNLGAMLRVAAGFAIDRVYLSTGCVELYNPKVVRSTMGALFSLPICPDVELTELGARLHRGRHTMFVADPHEGISLEEVSPPSRWALVIGGETHGYAQTWRTLGARQIHIPMTGRIESLNSAVAAGILLYRLTNPPRADHGSAAGAGRTGRTRRKIV